MNIRSIFNHPLLASLTGRHCLLCGNESGRQPTCAACHTELPWHRQPQCPQCAAPTPGGEICGHCLKRPPAFDQTCTALAYAFPLDRLIPRLKYHGELAIVPLLGHCLTETVRQQRPPDCLMPVPLHPTRIRERGFNHATEIARVVAHALHLPLDTRSCQRTRDTPPQMGLKFDTRRRNLRSAFICTSSVRNKHIALIDDVMTTGSSLNELAATLKRAGASEVSCWVVARALAKNS